MNIKIMAELIATGGILSVSIATLLGLLGRWEWKLDLFSHFRLQYLILLIVFTSLSSYLGNTAFTYLGLAFTFFNSLSILPLYLPARWMQERLRTSRILLSNVLRPNEEYEKIRQLIQITCPDIIVLLEICESWLQELEPELKNYPYKCIALHDGNYGIALFSHYKVREAKVRYFSDAQVPSITASIDINGNAVTIIATHPPPPKSKAESLHRDQQLSNIATYTASLSIPFMLVGDLNLTSWSPYFRELINHTGLRDSRQGFGIQPTWPTDKPVFLIPLDHVLVSEGITVHDRFVGPVNGSDHRPVIVDFTLETHPVKVDDAI